MSTKEERSNIELIQLMMSQNYSIEECARLMCAEKGSETGLCYWRKRIKHLVDIGEIKA